MYVLDSVISILENRIFVPTIILESMGCTYVTRVKGKYKGFP